MLNNTALKLVPCACRTDARKVLQKKAGYTSEKTSRRYAHVYPSTQQVAISREFGREGRPLARLKPDQAVAGSNPVAPDLSTLDWSVIFPAPSVARSIKVAGDSVYVTGADGGHIFICQQAAVTGEQIRCATYLPDITGVGNDIGLARDGTADVAMTVTDAAGNDLPGYLEVTPDGVIVSAVTYASNGPGASMNAVTVDAAGNTYYVGTIYATGSYYNGYSYLLVVSEGQARLWSLFDSLGHRLNWVGYSHCVDAGGDQAMATTYDDGTNSYGSHGWLFFETDPTGGTAIDFGDGGLFGSGDDNNYGLALRRRQQIGWWVGPTRRRPSGRGERMAAAGYLSSGDRCALNPARQFVGTRPFGPNHHP